MNPIQDLVPLSSGTGSQPASGTASETLGQEDFFQLMIAQLKNQDPTKPLDPNEYLSQLAQFSMVNGIQGLQQSFDRMATSLQSIQALQASSLIGRSVLVDSDSAHLPAGGSVKGMADLDADVKDLTVTIHDAGGRPVHSLALGDRAAGAVGFTWDGKDENGHPAPEGTYTLRVEGTVDGSARTFEVQVQAIVQSVTLGQGGQGMTVNFAGSGSLDIGQVQEIF